MKNKLILIGLIFLSGCATTSPVCNVPSSSGANGAKVVVYRPHGLVGFAYSTPMSIDQCAVGSLANNSYYIYNLPAGRHRIAVEKRMFEFGSGAAIEMEFKAGEIYYLRQTVSLVADLGLVDKNFALSEMPQLKHP